MVIRSRRMGLLRLMPLSGMLAAIVFFSIVPSMRSNGEEVDLDAATDVLVSQLDRAIEQKSEDDIAQLLPVLRGRGDAAIPDIAAAMAQANDEKRFLILGAVGSGDAGVSLLVQCVGEKASFPLSASRAIGLLENAQVTRPLSEQELKAYREFVESENVGTAGLASRALARCSKVSAAERVMLIASRFKSALGSPRDQSPIMGSYLSPLVARRNQFLLAFSYIGADAIPFLRQARDADQKRLDNDKWWVLALGYAGDASVADALEVMAESELDRYVRWAAVRAYARSAKGNAIPLLEKLVDDPTESEYVDCLGVPTRLISQVAKDELFRLQAGSMPPSP